MPMLYQRAVFILVVYAQLSYVSTENGYSVF